MQCYYYYYLQIAGFRRREAGGELVCWPPDYTGLTTPSPPPPLLHGLSLAGWPPELAGEGVLATCGDGGEEVINQAN